MSWLGGGLSSLTDQITHFTKEVLTEGREEVSDHVTELSMASRRIQELEVQCTTYRQEIERLRRRNGELEERCQATELQVTSVSAEYRTLLAQKEVELKQKHQELLASTTDAPASPTSGSTLFRFHGDDESDLGDLITSQLEINKLAAEVRKLHAERDHWRSGAVPEQVDEQNGKETSFLLSKIKELEKSLQEATDLNHHQVVALQDHYEHRLAEVQQSQQACITGLQKQLHIQQQGLSEDAASELQTLQISVEEARRKQVEEKNKLDELRKEQKEKEKTLQLLSRQIDKLQAEKLQLNKELKLSLTNLENVQQRCEADQINQENALTSDANRKGPFLPAPSSNGEQSTTTQAIQDIHETRTKLSTGAASIQNQLLQERQTIVDQLLETEKQKTELKCWLGMLEGEKNRLSAEIKSLIHGLGKDELLGYINALEEENTLLKNQNKETGIQPPESDRISSFRPEPLGESASDVVTHGSYLSQAATTVDEDDDDTECSFPEMVKRNRELSENVKDLLLQVATDKRDIAQLRRLLAEKGGSRFSESGSDIKFDIYELQNENTQLRNDIECLNSKNEKLINKLHTIKEFSKDHQKKLLDDESILEEKDCQIHELMEEKLSLEISLEELDAQNQEAMEKILLVKDDLVKTNKKLTKELGALQERCNQQDEEVSLLKTENETLQEQFISLAKIPQQENISASASQDSVEDAPPLKSILEAVNSINADNVELEENVHILELQRNELEAKLLRAETSLHQKQMSQELSEKEMQSLSLQIATLETSLAEVTALKEEEKMNRKTAEDNCLSLKAQLKEMEAIVLEKSGSRQQDSDAELIARVQELTSEKENLQNEADDLWARMIATSQETENLNLEIGNLHLANRKLQEEMENIQVRCQQEIQTMEDKMEEYEKASAKLQDEGQQNQEVMQRELAKLQKELDDVVTQRDQEKIALEKKCNDIDRALVKEQEERMLKEQALEKINALLMASKNDVAEELYASSEKNQQIGQPDSTNNEKCLEFLNSAVDAKIQTSDEINDEMLREKDQILIQVQNELKSSRVEVKDLLSEVERLKTVITDLEKVQVSEGATTRRDKDVNELTNLLKQKDAEISLLNSKIESLLCMVDCEAENTAHQFVQDKLCKLEMEKEQMLSVMNEKSRECSSLKAEVHRLMSIVSAEKQALSKLQQDNQELVKQSVPDQEMTKEAVQSLSRLVKDRDIEIEALKQKNETLLQFIQQSSSHECLEALLQEKEMLSKQVLTFQSEREQIITVLQQKHQESLQYHGEVLRLNSVLLTESQKYESLQEQNQSVSQSFEEKQKVLLNTQNELVSLKARVVELERQQSDLRQKYVQLLEKDPEIVHVQRAEYDSQVDSLAKLSEKIKEYEALLLEKDRLIYNISKELSEAKEEAAHKEENLVFLQNRLDSSGFQLNEAQRQVEEAGSGSENLRRDVERWQEECTMLKETNRSLSMMVKRAEFEKEAMQEKVNTMTQIVNLQQQDKENADMQKMLENREGLEKQAQQLHQERDQAMLALSQAQAENSQLQTELNAQHEQAEKKNKELDRLRHHLIEVQEMYTQEALLAEEREKSLRNRLAKAEEKALDSSSVIMNASQQASIQVESLQKQISKVAQEREQGLVLISHLEDRVQEQAAGTTNLQLALEQIQRDHKREMQAIRKQHELLLEQEQGKKRELMQKLNDLQNQLTATSEALDAASRLSEQLDRKGEQIASLKEEVSVLQQKLSEELEEKREIHSHIEGKVDKQIMKSLVLGYFGSAISQKPEVVRLLARVLDFSQDEMNKVGLKLGKGSPTTTTTTEEKHGGWLSWIRLPSGSKNKSTMTSVPPSLDQSFTAQFVQFLQNESQPRPQIRLPIETTHPSRTVQISSTIQPNAVQSTNPRNFADHLLMKPISTTLPTFTPLPVEGAFKSDSSSNFLQEVLK